MTQAVFPKSIFPWTDRVDEVNVVFANDPNSLAAEIVAVENTLGTMPQVEKAPYSGNPVSYSSVDARISDVLAGNQLPYCSITINQFFVYNNQGPGSFFGHFNTFSKVYDPFGYYNGSDITIQASGLYIVTSSQQWGWHDSGYLRHSLYCDGIWFAGDRWDWDFAGFGPAFYEPSRQASTSFSWMGPLTAGQRLQVVSENGTSFNPFPVTNSWMRLVCLRKLPANALDS
jgi:hypothetical protein